METPDNNPLLRWVEERKELERSLLELRIVLAQHTGNITLAQMLECGISIERASVVTDWASLDAPHEATRRHG